MTNSKSSESTKASWENPEHRAKRTAAIAKALGRKEVREKISEGVKAAAALFRAEGRKRAPRNGKHKPNQTSFKPKKKPLWRVIGGQFVNVNENGGVMV